MAPLQEAVTTVTEPVGDFFSGLANLPSLQRKNEALTAEVADLKTQLARYGELQGNYDAMVVKGYVTGGLTETIAASLAGGDNCRNVATRRSCADLT